MLPLFWAALEVWAPPVVLRVVFERGRQVLGFVFALLVPLVSALLQVFVRVPERATVRERALKLFLWGHVYPPHVNFCPSDILYFCL